MPPVSQAAVDTQKLDLGPVRITYKGVDMGATLGNAAIKIKFDKADMRADQLGTTVLDRRVSGLMITIETEIAEVQNMDRWKTVFGNADLIDGGIAGKSVRFGNKLGVSDYGNAGALILHPLNRADADKSQDYLIYKATPSEDSEIVYGPTEQSKLKIVWNVYPDVSQAGYPQMLHGDPTIGVTAASAAAPSFSGTGGGTLGSVSVFSGFTKSEIITAVCVGDNTGAGNFAVSGSVSGPLGIAVVGVAFVCPVIAFTISDGTPDFVQGDTFTIATTSANYA